MIYQCLSLLHAIHHIHKTPVTPQTDMLTLLSSGGLLTLLFELDEDHLPIGTDEDLIGYKSMSW